MTSRIRVRLPLRRGSLHLLLLAFCGSVPLAHASQVDLQGLQEGGAAGTWDAERIYAACTRLALAPWPSHPVARRAYLQRMDAAKASCMTHSQFLANLGALWLEEGEPSQALIWLERSLLLDPGHLGAQADHALALAALGQPAARDALAEAWRARRDVPEALRARLLPGPISASAPLPAVRLGAAVQDGWVSYRELSALAGFESNLNQSPKLYEITLTPPTGPEPIDLESPLLPRRGAAVMTDLSWQLARSPEAGRIVRLGVNLGGRFAPGEAATNWRHVQLAGSVSQQWAPWRAQLDAGAGWVGGALNEPYRLVRLAASLERTALGCGFRASIDAESRTQSSTRVLDGRAAALSVSSTCTLWGQRHWNWGLALRGAVDEPVNPNRAGGRQDLASLGVRLQGALPGQARLDTSIRYSQTRDREGYSPLLADNARRHLKQSQFNLELSKPTQLSVLFDAEAVVQLSLTHQTSNLPLFRYHAGSLYTGLRWAW